MNAPTRRLLTELRDELRGYGSTSVAFHRACDLLDDEASKTARKSKVAVGPSRSKRRRRMDPPELTAAKRVVRERSEGRCEARTVVCDERAVHVHHKAGRRGVGCHAPERLLHVCEPCHLYVHNNPTESYAAGWLEKRLGLAS